MAVHMASHCHKEISMYFASNPYLGYGVNIIFFMIFIFVAMYFLGRLHISILFGLSARFWVAWLASAFLSNEMVISSFKVTMDWTSYDECFFRTVPFCLRSLEVVSVGWPYARYQFFCCSFIAHYKILFMNKIYD